MAIRTPEQPGGIGPAPSSPNIYQARDYLDRWIRIHVPWVVAGPNKNLQAAITTDRDVGCLYARVLIGGVTTVPVGEGHGVILPADLGHTTLQDLEDAGVTFEP